MVREKRRYISYTKLSILSIVTGSLGLTIPLAAMEKPMNICEYSGIDTHVAIRDSGYFIVSDTPNESQKSPCLSPFGTWEEDKEGFFRNHLGQYLNVIYVNEDGLPLFNSALKVASTQGLSSPPHQTTIAHIKGILPATTAIGTAYQMSMNIIDSLGASHTIDLNFTYTDNREREWLVTASCRDAAVIGPPYDAGMRIRFNHYGILDFINESQSANTPSLFISWASGAASSNIIMNFGLIGEKSGLRFMGNGCDLRQPETDGCEPGVYMRTTIDEDGYMWAEYNNGMFKRYACIPILALGGQGRFVVNPWQNIK